VKSEKVDVLIAGGGFAGLVLGIALRRALPGGFAVAVVDPALGGRPHDVRASAIVAAARRLLERIGVWDAIAAEAQPILAMRITDSRLEDVMRPVFLTFDGEVEAGEPFGHMIENPRLLAALMARAEETGVRLRLGAVRGFDLSSSSLEVQLSHDSGVADQPISARLLVAADGARSAIRKRAGIGTHGWSYSQSSIVTTVAHERDHGGCAEEHFLPAGPFAVLPLKGRRCSVVWTENKSEAERLIGLSDAEFHVELERRFGLQLGEIELVGPRNMHPLSLFMARSFVAERIALVGDAAHVIHPIAGQGLNMGLKDAAALAEVLVDAVRLGLDAGSPAVLERYQRWRRFDTTAMAFATDALNRLFSNRSDLLRLTRDVGLGLVDRVPRLKDILIREAAGLVGEVPKLLRGEAL
jgi:2-octaprenyl-6-methoxyphenol hydroxylase